MKAQFLTTIRANNKGDCVSVTICPNQVTAVRREMLVKNISCPQCDSNTCSIIKWENMVFPQEHRTEPYYVLECFNGHRFTYPADIINWRQLNRWQKSKEILLAASLIIVVTLFVLGGEFYSKIIGGLSYLKSKISP